MTITHRQEFQKLKALQLVVCRIQNFLSKIKPLISREFFVRNLVTKFRVIAPLEDLRAVSVTSFPGGGDQARASVSSASLKSHFRPTYDLRADRRDIFMFKPYRRRRRLAFDHQQLAEALARESRAQLERRDRACSRRRAI